MDDEDNTFTSIGAGDRRRPVRTRLLPVLVQVPVVHLLTHGEAYFTGSVPRAYSTTRRHPSHDCGSLREVWCGLSCQKTAWIG